MDSAYDAPQIFDASRALGHVPIIARNPRRGGKAEAEAEERAQRFAGVSLAEDVRFKERSGAERVNSALKDSYGGRFVRVRGHDKVLCHLMFGVLALTIVQLMRLTAVRLRLEQIHLVIDCAVTISFISALEGAGNLDFFESVNGQNL
jgi:hypothetical protein